MIQLCQCVAGLLLEGIKDAFLAAPLLRLDRLGSALDAVPVDFRGADCQSGNAHDRNGAQEPHGNWRDAHAEVLCHRPAFVIKPTCFIQERA
jgi:hypothetical protein